MAPRLKVYEANLDGVNDWIVAAPNQQAALDAWGVQRNLFAEGEAKVTDAEAAVTAAMAQPGVALRRPHGGRGAFTAGAGPDLQGWSAAAKAVGAKKIARKKAPPDRSKLDAAEAALAKFEAEAEERLKALAAERADLERREDETRRDIEDRRQALQAGALKAGAALRSWSGPL